MIQDYLNYSTLSYIDPPHGLEKFSQFSRNSDFYDARTFTDGKSCAQFYSFVKEDELIFAIRGSSSLKDFLIDADFRKIKLPSDKGSNGLVHSGFLSQYNSIKSRIFEIISRTSVSKITFVGHSLGGAVASICALVVQNEFASKKIKCVTFGSPRVGNKEFADSFNKVVQDSIRVVNGQDIVPTRPYWGYEHVKGLLSVGSPYTLWKYWGSVEDHYTESYKKSCDLPIQPPRV